MEPGGALWKHALRSVARMESGRGRLGQALGRLNAAVRHSTGGSATDVALLQQRARVLYGLGRLEDADTELDRAMLLSVGAEAARPSTGGPDDGELGSEEVGALRRGACRDRRLRAQLTHAYPPAQLTHTRRPAPTVLDTEIQLAREVDGDGLRRVGVVCARSLGVSRPF
eukprot:COSAG01_NODE_8077_length_2930_cov_3.185800_5_plen_170_part_00